MRVDFTIISLFNCKYKVNSSAFQAIFIESKVPGAHLKQMQTILGNLFLFNSWHQFIHGFHYPFAILILFHEASAFELFDVEELVFGCVIFKALWNLIITITNTTNDQVLLTHFNRRVSVHNIIILNDRNYIYNF